MLSSDIYYLFLSEVVLKVNDTFNSLDYVEPKDNTIAVGIKELARI
jgi:hypothetical protein